MRTTPLRMLASLLLWAGGLTTSALAQPMEAPDGPAGPAVKLAADSDLAAKLEALTRRLDQSDREKAELKAAMAQLQAQVATTSQPDGQVDRMLLAKMIQDEVSKCDALRSGIPTWLDGMKFYGDVRLRYEGQWFDQSTPTLTAAQIKAGKKLPPQDYDRLRYRVRFGFSKDINEDWSLGFRLGTGNGTDPFESNQTMTGDFTRNSIWVDQAWIQYKPKALNSELTVVGGKFANPFIGTDMTWDPDVTMEGVAENWTHKCRDNVTVFATLGQLFMEQNRANVNYNNDYNGYATALLAYQLGMRYKLTPDVAWTMAATFWQYINTDKDAGLAADVLQSNNLPLGNSLVKGPNGNGTAATSNFLGAKDFEIVDLYTDVTWLCGKKKTPVRVFGDVVWNLGDKAVGAYQGQDFAGIVGSSVGKINWKKGDWEIGYNYRYVQADALISSFSDNAFWGTDKEGHTVAARYGVADNVTLNFKYVIFDWITDNVDPGRNMIRFEVEARF